jgi:cobalamin biosynthesis protein CobT
MWEDMDITVAERVNPPAMVTATPLGPAVHFGPYRMVFNRDVTVSVPYDGASAGDQVVRVYIYNHATEDWDEITPASVDEMNNLVTFETQVLGLFQVASGDTDGDGILDAEDNCPEDANPGQENSDNDSHGNACDNCPNADNEDQADSDGDGIGDVCDSAQAAIPTLSEWGMIIFMTIILGLGVITLLRRRMV